MSLNRYAPKRDANEPEIRKRFARHGWHTEQLSGKGMPDLLAWPPEYGPPLKWPRQSALLVDVKEPTGKPTPAQVEKWTALAENGIPVYVARTEADVDAIVAGAAEPWNSNTKAERIAKRLRGMGMGVTIVADGEGRRRSHVCGKNGCRKHRPCEVHGPKPVENAKGREFYGQIGKPPFAVRVISSGYNPNASYRPPPERHPDDAAFNAEVKRRIGLSAAKEAEATFAPGHVPSCDHCGETYRATCFDPKAPPGSVKCLKYIHCYRYDGHDGECMARNPRACTT